MEHCLSIRRLLVRVTSTEVLRERKRLQIVPVNEKAPLLNDVDPGTAGAEGEGLC